jgi:hypothetical protein
MCEGIVLFRGVCVAGGVCRVFEVHLHSEWTLFCLQGGSGSRPQKTVR